MSSLPQRREAYQLDNYIQQTRQNRQQHTAPTVSYDIIKDAIRRTYDDLGSMRKGNIAVDVASNMEAIVLQNTSIGFANGPDWIEIGKEHRIEAWINHSNLRSFTDEELRDRKKEIRAWSQKILALRDGGPLEGDYELNGIYHSYSALGQLQLPLYIFAESARFTFDSERYAKVTDSQGNVMKYKDGTLDLEGAVFAVEGTNCQMGRAVNEKYREFNKDLKKACFWDLFGMLDGVATATFLLPTPSRFAGFVVLTIPITAMSVGGAYTISAIKNRIEIKKDELRASHGIIRTSFYGYIPSKS